MTIPRNGPRVYRCDSMEQAALLLDSRYRRTLITSVYCLTNPVRLRARLLSKLRPFISRGREASKRQVENWLVRGGTLLNYRAAFERQAHDAHLICETPLTMRWLDSLLERTGTIAAIYRPPSWRSHQEEMGRIAPPVEWCQRFEHVVRECRLDNRQVGILDALGLDSMAAGCIPDADAARTVGVTLRELTSVRRWTLRGVRSKAHASVIPVIPRVPPENDRFRGMYDLIRTLPEHNGVRLVLGPVLMQAAPFWKSQLRSLVRCGAVQAFPRLGFYWPHEMRPNYKRIQQMRDKAESDLQEVISYVDSLPQLPTLRLPRQRKERPASSPPSGVHAPHESVAHFHDSSR